MKSGVKHAAAALILALIPAARGDDSAANPIPMRADVEALIGSVGRDPVSAELVDRVDATFRPRGMRSNRFHGSFGLAKRRAGDPKFVAGVDRAAKEVSGKPADTRMILALTNEFWDWDVPGEEDFRIRFRSEWEREKGPRIALAGRVVEEGEAGKPIGDVVVSCDGFQTSTDADGKYALKVPKPKVGEGIVAFFEAPGKALGATHFLWDDKVPDQFTRDYKMIEPARFGGRVLDADEKPIAGALLELAVSDEALARDGSTNPRFFTSRTLVARTDDEGRYAFGNVPPAAPDARRRPYSLFRASHPKYVPHEKSFNMNEPLGPGFEVVLERGCVATGVVVDPDGKPVPETSVTAQTSTSNTGELTALTDKGGRFRFEDLPAGSIEFIVRPTEFVQAVVKADVSREEPAELKVDVVPGYYFEGTVVDGDGQPAKGVMVGWLEPIGADGRKLVPNHQIRRWSYTKDDGTFRVGPVDPAFRYKITALIDPPRSIATEQVEADGKPVRLELKPDMR